MYIVVNLAAVLSRSLYSRFSFPPVAAPRDDLARSVATALPLTIFIGLAETFFFLDLVSTMGVEWVVANDLGGAEAPPSLLRFLFESVTGAAPVVECTAS